MSADFEFYEKGGRKFDRITSVLDYFAVPELVDWKLRVGKREANLRSKTALKIGSTVDEYIRASLAGGKFPLKTKSPDVDNCIKAFLDWKQEHWVQGLNCPETVFCDELGVAGTPDLLWFSEYDPPTVVDVKCSSMIRPSYWLQTEFYGRLLHCTHKAILRLNKKLGLYEFQCLPLSDYDWNAVKAAIVYYRFYQKHNKLKNGESNEHGSNDAGGSSTAAETTSAEATRPVDQF